MLKAKVEEKGGGRLRRCRFETSTLHLSCLKATLSDTAVFQVRKVGETVYGTVTSLATALEFPISVLKVSDL